VMGAAAGTQNQPPGLDQAPTDMRGSWEQINKMSASDSTKGNVDPDQGGEEFDLVFEVVSSHTSFFHFGKAILSTAKDFPLFWCPASPFCPLGHMFHCRHPLPFATTHTHTHTLIIPPPLIFLISDRLLPHFRLPHFPPPLPLLHPN
jgi:hypothetical protein